MGIRKGKGLSSCGAASVVAIAVALAFACSEDSGGGPVGENGSGGPEGGRSGDSGADGTADSAAGPGGDCGADPADDVCTACMKMNCCTEWKTCRAEQACTTCTDCLGKEQDLGTCNFTSGTCAFMAVGDPTARVLSCGLTPCETACGFS